MEKYRCPCCGAAYNGKRCRECFYEPFTEEISHGLHTHEGEPLVISEPVEKPVKKVGASRRPGCGSYSGRRKSALPKWILPVAIVLTAIILRNALAEAAFDRIWDIPGGMDAELDSWNTIVRPEEFHSQTVLYDGDGIQVVADWDDGDPGVSEIPVYVRNDSGKDIWITSTWDSVNGYMAQYHFLACSIDAGDEAMTSIRVDDSDLADGNIETIAWLSFALEINDDSTYTTIGESPQIILRPDAAPDFVQPVYNGGTLIYQQADVQVFFTGKEGDDCEDGALLFRIENHSGHNVGIYTSEAYVNGESAGLYLFGELAPGTWGKRRMWLYALPDMGIADFRDIASLEIVLGISDCDSDEFLPESERISIPITK